MPRNRLTLNNLNDDRFKILEVVIKGSSGGRLDPTLGRIARVTKLSREKLQLIIEELLDMDFIQLTRHSSGRVHVGLKGKVRGSGKKISEIPEDAGKFAVGPFKL